MKLISVRIYPDAVRALINVEDVVSVVEDMTANPNINSIITLRYPEIKQIQVKEGIDEIHAALIYPRPITEGAPHHYGA